MSIYMSIWMSNGIFKRAVFNNDILSNSNKSNGNK